MPTINQIINYKRKKKEKKKKTPILNKCPQKKAFCLKVSVMKPKKPNSARRNVGKLAILKTKKKFIAYLPGQQLSDKPLQAFSTILVRGGRVKDLPGVKYKMVRGKYDLASVVHRRKSRSKYGTHRWGQARVIRPKPARGVYDL